VRCGQGIGLACFITLTEIYLCHACSYHEIEDAGRESGWCAAVAWRDCRCPMLLPRVRVACALLLAPPPRTRRTSVSEMQAEMKEMVQYFKSSRPVEPGRPVLAPGDPERAAMAERSASEPGRFHLGIGPY
jgi:hypothetical protein